MPRVQHRNVARLSQHTYLPIRAKQHCILQCVRRVRCAHSRGHFGSQQKTRSAIRRALARCE